MYFEALVRLSRKCLRKALALHDFSKLSKPALISIAHRAVINNVSSIVERVANVCFVALSSRFNYESASTFIHSRVNRAEMLDTLLTLKVPMERTVETENGSIPILFSF